MANYVDAVITEAKKWPGYHEKNSPKNLDQKTASNDGNGNYTYFGQQMDTTYKGYFNGKKNGYEWCTSFVSYCFCKAYGITEARKLLLVPTKDNCSASCKYAYSYFKKKKQTSKTPVVGAQAFFGKSEADIHHTGLVVKVDSKKVYLIEGNKSNMVKNTSYSLNTKEIYAYGIPKFDVEPVPEPTPTPEETKTFTVNVNSGSYLNLRSEPNTKSKVLSKMYRGDKFVSTKQQNGWAYGNYSKKNINGWASMKYLK